MSDLDSFRADVSERVEQEIKDGAAPGDVAITLLSRK